MKSTFASEPYFFVGTSSAKCDISILRWEFHAPFGCKVRTSIVQVPLYDRRQKSFSYESTNFFFNHFFDQSVAATGNQLTTRTYRFIEINFQTRKTAKKFRKVLRYGSATWFCDILLRHGSAIWLYEQQTLFSLNRNEENHLTFIRIVFELIVTHVESLFTFRKNDDTSIS